MMRDAMEGQRAMDRLFGSHWQRVFVPPFHALTMPFKSLLPSLGYRGLSSGLPYKPRLATVPEVRPKRYDRFAQAVLLRGRGGGWDGRHELRTLVRDG